MNKRPKLLLSLVAAVLSGLLLAFAFPPFKEQTSAWFAFVPLLVVCSTSSPREAFRWGLVAGMSFWLVSISWLLWLVGSGGPLLLVVLAWMALSVYCSAYTAAFAAVIVRSIGLLRVNIDIVAGDIIHN